MVLEDFLAPEEEVHFRSGANLRYGGKRYQVILTNKRLLLYARRGALIQSDDVVSFKVDDLAGVRYKEVGMLPRLGVIEVRGKTNIQLEGIASQTKALYQQLLQFL
jgi:hypothetical protein